MNMLEKTREAAVYTSQQHPQLEWRLAVACRHVDEYSVDRSDDVIMNEINTQPCMSWSEQEEPRYLSLLASSCSDKPFRGTGGRQRSTTNALFFCHGLEAQIHTTRRSGSQSQTEKTKENRARNAFGIEPDWQIGSHDLSST